MALVYVNAQEADPTPIYTAVAETVTQDDYFGESLFPKVTDIKVEAYEGYVILRGWSGVDGRDLKVSFDADENATEVTAIRNGVDQTPIGNGKSGYVYTGLNEPNAIYVYVMDGYSYAGYEGDAGYVFLYAYFSGEYNYYYCTWGDTEESDALYTSYGEVAPTEGWGETPMPTVCDITVMGYGDYIIINGFAGVEGYDIKVEFGESDAVLGITPIINGVIGSTVTSGDISLSTGREDFPEITMNLSAGHSFGATDAEEASGYFITRATFGDESGYYFIVWPQGDESHDQWENPFEGEATFLYQATGETAEAEGWGETVFPEVKDIKVDVYDKYIYIHGIGGVPGYDAKVAYNESEEVVSIIGIVDGVESEPCKSYLYLKTGLESFPTIQAYTDYSYAASYDDGTGYVLLCAYIYDENKNYTWGYYYLYWDEDGSDGIKLMYDDYCDANKTFNILGQPVNPDFYGIVIKDGKKLSDVRLKDAG